MTMSLLLTVSNGLSLKSVGDYFQLLEFRTYNGQNSFHNSATYIFQIVLYIYFPPCNFMENIVLFFSLILPRKILYIVIYLVESGVKCFVPCW